jgi:2-iminobutanoate/2-iminopropanoate deaminase
VTEKQAVRTEAAPAPYQGSPYSQAITAGDLVFVSGQLGVRPESGELVGATIEEQTEQVFANLGAILDAAGSGLDRIVKTTVYLTSLANFPAMNDVYRRHVGDVAPARATVEISALPTDALIEIDAIGLVR